MADRPRRLRVLLVEDSNEIRESLALLLLDEGIDVVATGLGAAALKLAPRLGADVILTDLGLPDIPGLALIRHLLRILRPRPRIIVVTGFGEPYLSQAREAGADVVFTKPLAWETLRQHLRRVAARGRRRGTAA
ncbi:MAG: response regulator [Candidatus Rokuibacteriota bacterium]